jgi:adenylylsulfate kinase-like enzyme
MVVCATIGMFRDVLAWNRENMHPYIEVLLDVPKPVLVDRDPRGLYARFFRGEATMVAGFDLDVEWPAHPNLVLNSSGELSVDECVDAILAELVDVVDSKGFHTAPSMRRDTGTGLL